MYADSHHHDDSSSFDGSLRSSKMSLGETSSQRSSISRPSGKFIYRQRKKFAESIHRKRDCFEHRVEHLLTCKLDGQEIHSIDDCVAQLQLLDAKGQVWGQDVTLEVSGCSLRMTDMETKEELETIALDRITDVTAVLGRCVYNSLLVIVLQRHHKGAPSAFLFHCAYVGAEYVRIDLERAIRQRKTSMDNEHTERENKEVLQKPEIFQGRDFPAVQTERQTLTDHPKPKWDNYEDHDPAPVPPSVQEDQSTRKEPPPPVEYTETERNVEIFNHLLSDMEVFMGKVEVVLPKEQSKKNKNNMMKMKKKSKVVKGLPPQEEFFSCLQKVKYGFNLLGIMDGEIQNPSAQEFVHSLFSVLTFVVPHYPPNVPPTVVAPLLTEQTIRLLSEEAGTEEDQLWQSLGDAWNIPSSKWPDEEPVMPYLPEFYNGWQPPPLVKNNRYSQSKKGPPQHQKPSVRSSPPARFEDGSSLFMHVMYDFTGRNYQELSVLKGDVVQVLDQTKQWWKVRNNKKKEGYIPNNMLKALEEDSSQEDNVEAHSPAPLNKRSKPEEVKGWLQHAGFSPITVRCLSVLSGSVLLGMTRDELKTMCPEEGGRVFSQLQAVRATMA